MRMRRKNENKRPDIHIDNFLEANLQLLTCDIVSMCILKHDPVQMYLIS